MKISVNDEVLFELNETQKKVICNDVHNDVFDADMKRRLEYILKHKYEQCFKRLKEEWEPKLKAAGVKAFPSDEEEFAKLVFEQPDYKCRKDRDAVAFQQ